LFIALSVEVRFQWIAPVVPAPLPDKQTQAHMWHEPAKVPSVVKKPGVEFTIQPFQIVFSFGH